MHVMRANRFVCVYVRAGLNPPQRILSMDKEGVWLISAISIKCKAHVFFDFGVSSSSNIQVLQKQLHAQRGRYFCKVRRLEQKERSLFAQEAT